MNFTDTGRELEQVTNCTFSKGWMDSNARQLRNICNTNIQTLQVVWLQTLNNYKKPAKAKTFVFESAFTIM